MRFKLFTSLKASKCHDEKMIYEICVSVQNGWFNKIVLRNHSISCDVWKNNTYKKNKNEK